jgi:hypothetical protein
VLRLLVRLLLQQRLLRKLLLLLLLHRLRPWLVRQPLYHLPLPRLQHLLLRLQLWVMYQHTLQVEQLLGFPTHPPRFASSRVNWVCP